MKKVAFFDFIDTIADVSMISHEELHKYVQTVKDSIATGVFKKTQFNEEWAKMTISKTTLEKLDYYRDIYTCVVLTNAPMPVILYTSTKYKLRWDAVLCADMFRRYKPDLQIYLDACELMNIQPSEAVMIANHEFDTNAAKSLGMGRQRL